VVDFRGLDRSLSCAGGASGSSEDERVVCQNSLQIMTKLSKGHVVFWLLTNSDEVNLNSQKIDKKIDKLNAGSLGEQNR